MGRRIRSAGRGLTVAAPADAPRRRAGRRQRLDGPTAERRSADQLPLDAELAAAEKLPAAKRGDVLKCHAAAQKAFDQAQKALSRHRQLMKTGPSPIDLRRQGTAGTVR